MLAARLECPRTEDTGVDITVYARDLDETWLGNMPRGVRNIGVSSNDRAFETLSAATNHLGREACKVVCGDCPFSNMTKLEVSEWRAVDAENDLAIVHNEQRRLTARVALEEAVVEIAELNARLGNQQLPPQ